jgi:hypothetical protein
MRAQVAQGPGGAASGAGGSARGVLPVDNPVADPKAVVTVGNARFTVLTPQLIRMEWSADGKFEDHASFVFINRRLPVPRVTTANQSSDGVELWTIKTDALTVSYMPSGDGHFTSNNLSITLNVDGNQWCGIPG